ncbi:putative peroxiredoxin bcp [Variibacter gotjawalensis]|uniref:thioredoxin-dependent peroxiredoxin n=1 Tax=Variibacter gotjawalensis TaxID=1333996 RepID=A0A0S3PY22_9BRAD|nr:thioredoxin-dependent thiol peroxidase [Variibacter gotjawalensis]NIK46691.1 peroxiredoxin Q/BCP [Variibacter gotjawalensis]RZS48594.1 peroxiredoxin Q/BCP [Variibacter gotjawalensis]BAT60856.1 putative peroxiredoxin bcp [Variibacter gotjawalensis]
MTDNLAVGDTAPDFSLPADGGNTVSLKDFRGQKLVLFFYPKADTPGCTVESRAFSALAADFAKANAAVIGASADPVKAQDKFKKKYDLKVPLASDEDHAMLGAYGAWTQKSMFGHKYMGIERSTFLIDEKGKIAKIWRKVKVPGHAEAVLKAVKDGG